jgi:magnesium chelatase family protein
LDELPEFNRRTLDMLRQPLEDEYIDLSRVGYRNRYPCRFILIVAMNPCPCGYYGDPSHTCTCGEAQRRKYLSKVSGPFLDRIDMHVQVASVEYAALRGKEGSSSAELLEGVMRAREMQRHRYGAEDALAHTERLRKTSIEKRACGDEPDDPAQRGVGMRDGFGGAINAFDRCNARISSERIAQYCRVEGDAEHLLRKAYTVYGFSARQGQKMLRLARTIADIEGSEIIRPEHISEAISYRRPSEIGGGHDA